MATKNLNNLFCKVIDAIKEKCTNSTTPVIRLEPNNVVNNQARNKDILSRTIFIVASILVVSAGIFHFLFRTGVLDFEQNQKERYIFTTLLNNTIVCFVVPCLVYFKNKGLRKYVKEWLSGRL